MSDTVENPRRSIDAIQSACVDADSLRQHGDAMLVIMAGLYFKCNDADSITYVMNKYLCTNNRPMTESQTLNRPAIGRGHTHDLPESAEAELATYWMHLEDSGLGWQSIRSNHAAVRRCIRALVDADLHWKSDEVGRREILHLRDVEFAELSPDTNKWYITLYGRYLHTIAGNDIVRRMELRWAPAPTHPRVDWLDEGEVAELMHAKLDVPEKTALMLMLCMGLRRVEVIRICIDHIEEDCLLVLGKGRGGGKPRRIPWAPGVRAQIDLMLEWRQLQVADADGGWTCPHNLFLTRTSKPNAYSEMGTSFDSTIIRRIQAASGVKFGAHTLRRTFARAVYRGGARVEVVAGLLGHTDIQTTLQYIGLADDDARIALASVAWA